MFIHTKHGFLSNVFVFHLRALNLAIVTQVATSLVTVKDCQNLCLSDKFCRYVTF